MNQTPTRPGADVQPDAIHPRIAAALPPCHHLSGMRLTGLCALFLLIAWGLGYATLNRYDPRQVPGLADVKTYANMVTGNPAARIEHMRYRVLVPWMARPFYWIAARHVASWDPVLFGLLAANSLFVAGTALLIVAIGSRILSYPVSLVGSLLYLLNFAVPNLRLVGLVDAAEAFFLLALYWTLLDEQLWLLPIVAAFGVMAKESYLPFSIVFTTVWWMLVRKRLSSPRHALLRMAASWVVSLASLLIVHYAVAGQFDSPLAFAEELRGNNHYLMNLWSSVWDRNFGYVFVWLIPLGIPRLKVLPSSWLIPTAAASALAVLLNTYYTGAYGTLARALFSTAGPLLSLSTASLLLGRETGVAPRE